MPQIDLKDFLAFARSKPQDETYNGESNFECALCQYGRSLLGVEEILAGSRKFSILASNEEKDMWRLPEEFQPKNELLSSRHSWGELASALETFLAKEPA